MSGGSGNYHLPTSTTTTTQQPQRFQFLSKLRNQRQQQQQVVPTTTTMPGRGASAGAGEARASGENNNNNNNGIGHSNGLPALPTSRRQQQQHSSSLCTTDAPADHYYSQPMPIAPPSRPQRGSRASNGQHSIAYAGEHSPQQRHQQQPVVASSQAANRRTEVASYARSQQQQQVYGAMSHTNGGHYEPQQQQQQHRSSRHYQQMQGQFQLGNNSVTHSNGSKTGSYSTGNDDAGRAPVESGEFVLSAYDDEDDEADQHYAAQLRRAQMQQQPMGATCKQQRARECHDHDNHRRHHNHIHNHQNHAEQNNHRLDQSGSATAAAAAASDTQQQQQPIAAGDNTQRQHQAHSPRESLHVNFNRSSQRAGGGGVGQGEDEEGAESTRKKKYLTAKYGQQQMNLIKKRLKIEMWLHEQLQQLAAQSKSGVDPDELDEIDIDLDQLLDMEDDAIRRNWLVKTLEPFGELPRDALEKFICDVLEQSKLL